MEQKKSPHPQWALECKRKGTELRLINGRYYLYGVSSKWDPVKKRSRKISGKILGSISEKEGFVESEKHRLRQRQIKVERAEVKEFGVTEAIEKLFAETLQPLKEHFPDAWQQLVCLAYGRLLYCSPLKNMFFHYSHSYLSQEYPNLDLSAKTLGAFLNEVGASRGKIVDFCRSFKSAQDNILFDGTDLVSNSEKMELPKLSRCKNGTYNDIINLMCVFSTAQHMPLYYRLLPGNIKDVSAFKTSLLESGVDDAIVIVDKGFASECNIAALEAGKLHYIVALRRDSTLINYAKIKESGKRALDGYFQYEGRYVWHYSGVISEGKKVVVFLDEELRIREQRDYLDRIQSHAENYSVEDFHEKQHVFGTFAVLENTGKSASEVYAAYKMRMEVETMIDTLKNVLDADRTYMQNQQTLEGWMFVNLIALKWYYILLNLLKKHNLNAKYSPMDMLMMLAEIKKVKINNDWFDAEITHKTRLLLQTLGIRNIT